MESHITKHIKNLLNERFKNLENKLEADVLVYYGPILDNLVNSFLKIVEDLANDENKKDVLYIVLTTTGGSAIAVERYVNILRNHYNEINFIVVDYAYSAGTIFCMSGDNIYMDYFSVLGPIDPQVPIKSGKTVPALGYLDKVNELIEKSKNNTLSPAEFIILKEVNLAELRVFEQAKELTIEQLKKWLVKYKFKNWNKHKDGRVVTNEEKKIRAREIADKLSDNKIWKSHSRPINIETLETELKLKIEDFGEDTVLKNLLRDYYYILDDYVKQSRGIFMHTRRDLYE